MREEQSNTTGTFCMHRDRPGQIARARPKRTEHKECAMTSPTRLAGSMLALTAFVSMLAPLAARAQFDVQSQPEAGNYPAWSQQYDVSFFSVLSAETGSRGAVTCTDSTIMGNIGSSGARSSVVKTRCSVSGQVVAPVSPTVLAEFNNQFDRIGNKTCQKQLSGTLAGVILKPGVYCFPVGASVTGTLTLDGPSFGTWVIKVNGALTGKSFSMVMAGGGKPCNVYIESTGGTTMTTSNAKGNVFSGQAITMTGGSFVGRAFAKKAVTMTDIAATGCVKVQ